MGHRGLPPSAQLRVGPRREDSSCLLPLPFHLAMATGFGTSWVTLKDEVHAHEPAGIPRTHIGPEHRE